MDITDPSSMQNACHMNFVIHLAHRKSLSGRASERGIRRSENRFLIGTQNFFFLAQVSLSPRKFVEYFAIVPFLEYSKAASYVNRHSNNFDDDLLF